MDYSEFYIRTYNKDNPPIDPYGWIQYKDTKLCIYTHCICGYLSHLDGDFIYFCECPKCHKKYMLGQNIKLIELDREEIEYVEDKLNGFVIDNNSLFNI